MSMNIGKMLQARVRELKAAVKLADEAISVYHDTGYPEGIFMNMAMVEELTKQSIGLAQILDSTIRYQEALGVIDGAIAAAGAGHDAPVHEEVWVPKKKN